MGTLRIGQVFKTSPSTAFWVEADWVRQESALNRSILGVWLCASVGPSGNSTSRFDNWGEQYTWWGGGRLATHAGQPFLPSGYAQNQLRWADYSEHAFTHDSAGRLEIRRSNGSLGMDLGMHLGYGSVNEDHYGWIPMPGRIAKAPPAPTPIGIDQVGPTSMRYRFSAASDDGGAAVTEWQIGYGTNPTTPQSFVTSGGTTVLTGLVPGTRYYVWSRGKNSVGWSSWSAVSIADTMSGGRVKVSGSWRTAIPWVKVGSEWKRARPYVKSGGTWHTSQ